MELVICGAGGHAKVVLDIARSPGFFDPIVFVDDDPTKVGHAFCNCGVVRGREDLPGFNGSAFVIAVGNNARRSSYFGFVKAAGLAPVTLIHASATIAPSAIIGLGTVVMPGAIVNASAVIGENCIINSAAVVEHDCIIGSHVHISPRVALGGNVTIGTLAHIGIGAIVLPGATVGEEAIVGAGAVVLKEVPPRRTVIGVPAKVLSRS